MSEISVRTLEARDAAAWAAMRSSLWPDADAGELRREVEAFVAGVPLPTPEIVFVAERLGAIGFLELSVRPYANGCDSMPVPFVEGWYVVPGARRAGVGRALMRAAEVWALERGYYEMGSDTEADNQDSIEAHRQCGFAEAERVVYFNKKLF